MSVYGGAVPLPVDDVEKLLSVADDRENHRAPDETKRCEDAHAVGITGSLLLSQSLSTGKTLRAPFLEIG